MTHPQAEPAAHPHARDVVERVVRDGDAALDPAVGMPACEAPYNPIHTNVRSGTAHRYNDAFYYALALAEVGRYADAAAVLAPALAGQDTDPDSPTYGVWGYYASEHVSQMVPPDWNQADFNGRVLAFLLLRHADALDADTRTACERALRHAGRSIIRRDVGMDYTNIAAKGLFVTMAAGRVLDDPALAEYASQRLRRLAARVDRTGTFNEFASPTYWLIAAEAFQACTELVVGGADRPLLERLRHRHLEHLAVRWNASLGQMAGPMSRAYGTDVRQMPGLTMFLQTAITNAGGPADVLPSVPLDLVAPASIITALLHPVLPDDLLAPFAGPVHAHQHRELVVLRDERTAREQEGSATLAAQVATSWIADGVSLGSINQSDTWLQRRVLLAQWRTPDGDLGEARLRLMRDEGDWAAGSFSSVQDGPHVLWGVGVASTGGREHIHLDTVGPDVPVEAARVAVRLQVTGPATWSVDGESVASATTLAPGALVEISAGVRLRTAVSAAVGPDVAIELDPAAGTLDAVLWRPAPGDALASLDELGALGMLEFDDGGAADAGPVAGPVVTEAGGGRLSATLERERRIELAIGSRIGDRDWHAQAFAASIDDGAPPATRLSDERLTGSTDE